MSFDAAPVAELEALFRRIHVEQMADMPVLNPALSVEAPAFRRCEYGWLGVLITPWFMNLVLLPASGSNWPSLASGQQWSFTFPSGDYVFTADNGAETGEFLTCQLFSPMYHFPDQATARTAALAALEAVAGSQPEPAEAPAEEVSQARRRLFRGLLKG